MSQLIIHISGPSGSGKTTLGNKLIDKFKNKIIVKDVDDLVTDFINFKYKDRPLEKFNSKQFQKYINDFISKKLKSDKPIIFVGLSNYPWFNKNIYYNMYANYNFYIKLNSDKIYEQRCNRFLSSEFNTNKQQLIKDIREDEKNAIDNVINSFISECSYEQILHMNDIWNKGYKKRKYKFMSAEKIFKVVSKIINENL